MPISSVSNLVKPSGLSHTVGLDGPTRPRARLQQRVLSLPTRLQRWLPTVWRVAGIVITAAFALSGCGQRDALKPFTSDGCSLFPDSALISSGDWCQCCFEHDIAYWRGGTAAEREAADRALQACVVAATNNEALATVMYNGVRVGGSPYFYNWYRWGYGWSYERKYQSLTAAERRRSDALLAEYRQSDPVPVCQAPAVETAG